MKNLSIILNVILLAAVIVLYILHFTGGKETRVDDKTEADMESVEEVTSSVVFIYEDSLLSNYNYFQDELTKLKAKQVSSEQSLKTRAEGLQTEFENYRQTAGNLTINQARALEEDLMRKQQNLYTYEENLKKELLQEESRVNEALYEKVTTFLKEYAAENNYKIVFNFRRGNALLFAERGMNITRDVVNRLNQNYAKELQGKSAASDTTSTK